MSSSQAFSRQQQAKHRVFPFCMASMPFTGQRTLQVPFLDLNKLDWLQRGIRSWCGQGAENTAKRSGWPRAFHGISRLLWIWDGIRDGLASGRRLERTHLSGERDGCCAGSSKDTRTDRLPIAATLKHFLGYGLTLERKRPHAGDGFQNASFGSTSCPPFRRA